MIHGKGLLFRMVGMMIKDLTEEDMKQMEGKVEIIGNQMELEE